MKILTIFGTRPETIKLAPIIRCLEKDPFFEPYTCVTGQHREMLDDTLCVFGIRPDFDLDVMVPNQQLFETTSSIMAKLQSIIDSVQPALIIVQGDTTTTFAASLTAFYSSIPIAHIEAGIRSHNKNFPYPEEMNRQLTSRLATLHFSPCEQSKSHLIKENINASHIYVSGNTVIDSLIWMQKMIAVNFKTLNIENSVITITQLKKPIILVTEHRRESFGAGLKAIFNAIKSLAKSHQNWQFIFPVHLNPHVKKAAHTELSALPNIHLLPPLSYASFVYVMTKAKLIISDSGGVQEEAPALGKPVIVTRQVTDRPETIESGNAILAGTSEKNIIHSVIKLMTNENYYKKMSTISLPYGNGHAATHIINTIKEYSHTNAE